MYVPYLLRNHSTDFDKTLYAYKDYLWDGHRLKMFGKIERKRLKGKKLIFQFLESRTSKKVEFGKFCISYDKR